MTREEVAGVPAAFQVAALALPYAERVLGAVGGGGWFRQAQLDVMRDVGADEWAGRPYHVMGHRLEPARTCDEAAAAEAAAPAGAAAAAGDALRTVRLSSSAHALYHLLAELLGDLTALLRPEYGTTMGLCDAVSKGVAKLIEAYVKQLTPLFAPGSGLADAQLLAIAANVRPLGDELVPRMERELRVFFERPLSPLQMRAPPG